MGFQIEYKKSLAFLEPEIAKEWHSIRNGDLFPENFLCGSGKKVWWICEKNHEWQAVIEKRVKRNQKCPYCTNKRVNEDNSLAATHPDITEEWDEKKNLPLSPNKILAGSAKKVWWRCKRGHSYMAQIRHRTNGSDCPYCKHQKLDVKDSLGKQNPVLAKEWHPTKNKGLSPFAVFPYTRKKVWWLCTFGHAYQQTVANRSIGRGCPTCKNHKTSFPQETILFFMRKVFTDVEKNAIIDNNGIYEVDVFIKDINLAIEYDGIYWHSKSKKRDEDKNKRLLAQNIPLIRIREKGLPLLVNDYGKTIYLKGGDMRQLEAAIGEIFSYIDEMYTLNKTIKNKIQSVDLDIDKYKFEIYERSQRDRKNSIGIRNEDLMKEWHYEKNKGVNPYFLSSGSKLKVWWKCTKGHEWKSEIKSRNSGAGSPFCTNRKVNEENALSVNFPELVKEWHPYKNQTLKPSSVYYGSTKQVWWMCENGHEWKMEIRIRTQKKASCPYCSNKKVCKDNSLEAMRPELAKEWDHEVNQLLKPSDVTYISNEIVGWKCEKGHRWKQKVSARSLDGLGCPYCSKRLASESHSLLVTHPEIAKEWHPTKNGSLKPTDVMPGSGVKVWWKCNEGHEWKAAVYSRTSGKGCNTCNRKRGVEERSAKIVQKRGSLQELYPEIAHEWHPTKNGNLTPKDVTRGCGKEVWWKCEHDHEWKTSIKNRTQNMSICPACRKKAVK